MLNGNHDEKALPVPPSRPHVAAPGYGDAPGAAAGEETSGLWEYWAIAKRGKWWLLGFAVFGCLAGYAGVILTTPTYRSTVTLVLEGFNESFMGMNNIDPQAGQGNYGINQTNINTQLKIIESSGVRSQVLENMMRETTPVLPPSRDLTNRIRARLHRAPMDPLQATLGAIRAATFSVKAKSVTGTRLITITCESTIPEIAAMYLNQLANEYIAQNTQQRYTTTRQTSQWLQSQLETTKTNLDEAESRLQTFIRQTGVVYGGDQEISNVLTSAKIKELTASLAQISQDRIARETRYNAANEMIKKGTPEVIPEIQDSPVLKTLSTQLADARRKYDDLLQKYTPQNPKTFDAKRTVDDVQVQITKEREAILQRIRDDYQQTLDKEAALKKAYTAEVVSATGQQDKAAEYSLLRREVSLYQASMNSMLASVNQAEVVAAVPANNIRVLDKAFPMGKAVSPNLQYFLGIATFLGFGAGFGLVWLRDRSARQKFNSRFGAPGYAPTVLGTPELGVIPSGDFEAEEDTRSSAKWKWKRMKAPVLSLTGDGNGNLSVSKWQGNPSLLIESFRLTLTSLMLMFRDAPRVMVVTSPGPGEGKTTIAANLGMAMAEAGRRVLLVDLDLRRPQMHQMFDLPNERGFVDLVRGDELPLRVTEDHPAILKTAYPRVSVLAAGKIEASELGEIFHSPRVGGLLRQLRDAFDVIIVDTPPMLQFSESRLAASLADGALLVLRSGHTDKDSAMAARRQLAYDRVEVLGTILNDWDPKQGGTAAVKYGSYYSSYMKYRYHSAGKS